MKTTSIALVLAVASLASGSLRATPSLATTLASWNFDSTTISGASTDFGPITADFGTGSSTGHHSSSSTWSSPAGNASVKSFSSNTWAVGDYYQFQTSTTGFGGINVSWDQTGSATGPKDFKLQYSINGTSWTDFARYSLIVNGTPNTAWSSAGSHNSAFTFSYDLSTLSLLDNQTAAYFRLTDISTVSLNGGTVASGGTDRIDNFTVAAIPEPSTYALFAGLAGFAVAFWRRNARINTTSSV